MDSQQRDSFDPYLKWLGIRDIERPINHYRLLGIDLLESDPDVISVAADRQMSHVRRYQTGPQAKVSQEILNELAAAKLVLLDPVRKARYDAQFVRESNRSLKSRKRWLLVIPAVLVGLAAVTTAIQRPGNNETERPQSATENRHDVVAEETNETKPIQADALDDRERVADGEGSATETAADETDASELHAVVTESPSEGEPPSIDPVPEFAVVDYPVTPLPIPEATSVWNDVKLCLAEGRVEDAKRELRALANEIRTPGDDEVHQALFAIADLIEQFWRAVQTACRGEIPPETRLDYAGTPVTVKVVDARVFLTAPNGAYTDYPAQPRALPAVVAAMLAEEILDRRSDLYIVLWAFWAFDQRGNADQADRQWEAAHRYGSGISPDLVKAWKTTPESNRATEKRVEIPAQKDIKALRQKIESTLGINSRRPPTTAPESLLNYASLHPQDPTTQYVCHFYALQYATNTGRADIALQALDYLTANHRFEDPRSERWFWLNKLSRKVDGPRSAGLVAQAALMAARHGVNDDQYATANRLAGVAVRAAERSDNRELVQRSRDAANRVKRLAKAHREIVADQRTLETNTLDELANLRVGRFYCLEKGDFSVGLPYLAKSSDPELASLARDSLTPPAGLEARVEIANRWWDMAEKLPEFQRPQALEYAKQQYRMLQPETLGPLRKQVTLRLGSSE